MTKRHFKEKETLVPTMEKSFVHNEGELERLFPILPLIEVPEDVKFLLKNRKEKPQDPFNEETLIFVPEDPFINNVGALEELFLPLID